MSRVSAGLWTLWVFLASIIFAGFGDLGILGVKGQTAVISLTACQSCCDAVRDLDFWVGSQKTGSCRNSGCESMSCGGFACETGLNFRIGEPSGFQTDNKGKFVSYRCKNDGTVVENTGGSTDPTPSPTTPFPTHFPTTSFPTSFPVVTPKPTAFPTSFPVVTAQPTTSPTKNTTGFNFDSSKPLKNFFGNQMNMIIVISCGVALCAFGVLIVLTTGPKRGPYDKKGKNRFMLFPGGRKDSEFAYAFQRGSSQYTDDPRKSNFHISFKGPWIKTTNLFSSNPGKEKLIKDRPSQTREELALPVAPRLSSLDKIRFSQQHVRNNLNDDLADEDDIWEFREKSIGANSNVTPSL